MDGQGPTFDTDRYDRMVKELYEKYGTVTLPPEYSYYVRENMVQFLIRLARYKFVAKHLSVNDDVLEVGCASGLGTIFLSQLCHSVTAIDRNSQSIEEARNLSKRENVFFQIQDFADFSSDRGFDVLVSLDVLEHMSVEEGRKFIARAADTIKADGMLVIG
ncbi:MAG: class I SAM-dependent methyltransferase, partial [Desulfobacterales bacterium]|nr:class I SAM-dependent methyltransferase [Desulfobacterales bacterium]